MTTIWRECHRLHPLVTAAEMEETLSQVQVHGWQGLCVPPYWVKKVRRDIGPAAVHLATPIGYPMGYQLSAVKVAEAELALREGANELELTLNLSALRSGQPGWIKPEIARLAKLAHEAEALLTVILDVVQLTPDEVALVARLAADAGTDFVKHAIGLHLPPPEVCQQLQTLRRHLSASVGLKAVAASATIEALDALRAAGAERVALEHFSA